MCNILEVFASSVSSICSDVNIPVYQILEKEREREEKGEDREGEEGREHTCFNIMSLSSCVTKSGI